jgi:hypothetical protein
MPNGEQINNELEFQSLITGKTTDEKVDWLCWHIYQQGNRACALQKQHEDRLISLETTCKKVAESKGGIQGGLAGGGIGAVIGSAVVWAMNHFGIGT